MVKVEKYEKLILPLKRCSLNGRIKLATLRGIKPFQYKIENGPFNTFYSTGVANMG